MNKITSNQNPLIKEIKSLKEKKHREAKKLFFIEGIRFVEEALKAETDIERIIVSETFSQSKGGIEVLSQASKKNYEVYEVPDKLFNEISDTDSPQGILAVIKIKRNRLDDLFDNNSFIVILDSIQDPGNMGTIIRTADAAGAAGVIISRGCVDLYNPKVLRSTMGSIFHIPFYLSDNLIESIATIKSRGIKTYAAHLKGTANYYEVDIDSCSAIIVGNEANGISDEVANSADLLVKIPMPGRAESLNASVAASLLIYEAVRRRE
ncbi:MAG: 23S rRNA (guanosine(2251)-2'-O)-methyltransferase RlmB [Clostridia bacterium]|nr:23S rRNA (guanosine(2251)-2'-O)-methyltransferase RlmB [Clostridia bacterium]